MKTALISVAGISMIITVASFAAAEDPFKAPANSGTGTLEQLAAPGMQTTFQPIALDPELVKQSMQARAEYENLNRQIIARQTKLYDESPTIKDLQVKMREIQKKIDKILANDEELNKMKEKLKLVSPDMPVGMKKPVSGMPGAGPGAALPTPMAPVPPKTDKKP